MNAKERVQLIFREFFDDLTLKIDEASSMDSIEDWDSVASVQLVLSIEREFGIRFEMDEVASLHSVADILAILAKRGIS